LNSGEASENVSGKGVRFIFASFCCENKPDTFSPKAGHVNQEAVAHVLIFDYLSADEALKAA